MTISFRSQTGKTRMALTLMALAEPLPARRRHAADPGHPEIAARYQAERRARKAAAFAKRNPHG